jgi:hypothetical protein
LLSAINLLTCGLQEQLSSGWFIQHSPCTLKYGG